MKLQTLWARFPGVQTGVRADDTRGCREALGRSGRARTAVAAHDHRSPRTSADGGGKPGAPLTAPGCSGLPDTVAMETRAAWSPSPARPRVSAALEPSDWTAPWTLPHAARPLRG